MRIASKLMLLALLALPVGSVFAAQDLTVTINMTLTVSLNVVFNDSDLTAKTWAITGVGASSHSAIAGGTLPRLHNKGGTSVDVTVKVTDPTGDGHWSAGAAIGLDTYTIATNPATATTPIKETDSALAYQTIAAGAITAITDDITVTLPSSVSHISPGTTGTIVTYSATATP